MEQILTSKATKEGQHYIQRFPNVKFTHFSIHNFSIHSNITNRFLFQSEFWPIAYFLLKNGADAKLVNSYGETPLHVAVRNGNLHDFKSVNDQFLNPLNLNRFQAFKISQIY